MSLLVAGTLCFDTIETPHGTAERVLGGSAAYAALAASLFGPVRVISVVGDDFAPLRPIFENRGIGLRGVQVKAGAKTQFWHGRYHAGLHTREHVDVDLTIFDDYVPSLPDDDRDATHVFLAHAPPDLQRHVLDQLRGPAFVLADTIDHWISTRRATVLDVIGRVTALVVNDQEAELLTGERHPIKAARAVRGLGPSAAIIKKGEHGAAGIDGAEPFVLPAYPTEPVIDPTGAGDTFAGALAGCVAAGHPFRAGLVAGVVAASFTVEGFGTAALEAVTPAAFDARLRQYRHMAAV